MERVWGDFMASDLFLPLNKAKFLVKKKKVLFNCKSLWALAKKAVIFHCINDIPKSVSDNASLFYLFK